MTATVIALPSGMDFADASVTLQRGSVVLRSPYTGTRQVLTLPFSMWVFEGTLIPIDDPVTSAAIRAFLVDLDGRANVFKLPVPGVSGPVSKYAGANPTVNGASQTGQSLALQGITPSTLLFKRGDYFTVGDELKMAMADCTSNSSGNATVTFKPRLRASPGNGAAVEVQAPYILLSMQDDAQAAWKLSHPVIHSFAMKAIEAF